MKILGRWVEACVCSDGLDVEGITIIDHCLNFLCMAAMSITNFYSISLLFIIVYVCKEYVLCVHMHVCCVSRSERSVCMCTTIGPDGPVLPLSM